MFLSYHSYRVGGPPKIWIFSETGSASGSIFASWLLNLRTLKGLPFSNQRGMKVL